MIVQFCAIKVKAVSIDERKCIGFGLCVVTCPSSSLLLARKVKGFVPPKDREELYIIDQRKAPWGNTPGC